MVAHGCAMVQHDGLTIGLRRALFSLAMPELFALLGEAKLRNVSSAGPYGVYVGQIPGLALESVCLLDVADTGRSRDFSNLLWQQGNTAFCDMIGESAESVVKLEQKAEKMVLEGLDVQKKHAVDSYHEPLDYGLWLSYDGPLSDTETSVSLPAHHGDIMTTKIVEHEVEGLDMLAKDDNWFVLKIDLGSLSDKVKTEFD